MPGQIPRNHNASSGRSGEWASANATTLTPSVDTTITRGHNHQRSAAALVRGCTVDRTSIYAVPPDDHRLTAHSPPPRLRRGPISAELKTDDQIPLRARHRRVPTRGPARYHLTGCSEPRV